MLLSKVQFSKQQQFIDFVRKGPIMLAIMVAGVLISLIIPHKTEAQSGAKRWTPEILLQYDRLDDPRISPEGDHVAFVAEETIMDKTTSKFCRHIYVAGTKGTSQVQYTRGEHNNFHPRWSPDGKRIAFISTRGEKPQVYLIRRQGGEAYQVTDAKTGVSGFQWSPDGKRIAYLLKDPKSKAEKKREKQKRDVNRVNQEFRYDHLYTTQVKPADDTTRKVQRLTQGPFHVEGFDWSPDGETIAFSHEPNPRPTSAMKSDISTVPSDSGKVKTLVDMKGWDGEVHYSPNGKTIAFTSCGDKVVPTGLDDVYVIPASGGTPRKLAHTPNRSVDIISWTNASDELLVTDAEGFSGHIYAVPANGDPVRQISLGKGNYAEGQRVSVSRKANKLAFTYQNIKKPYEVYTSSLNDFNRQRITSINKGAPRPLMGKTELITWSGPGNRKIEGLLTYPLGYEEGQQVPLILDVHDGPTAAHERSFTGSFAQFYASQGYAVLRPNPRGSDGYGKEFRQSVIENWGPGPLKDLMAGVDKTIAMGVAHPDSLVIMGGSYGGYMTAYAVTQTDRFVAANMFMGISNLISDIGTSDNSDWDVAHMGGPYWNNLETYEKNSPIYHVDNVSTPTLVMHGAKDKRVPVSQGREFYRALKRQDVETEMIIFPRMAHGWNEPKYLIKIANETIDWFDEQLGRDRKAWDSE